jgi:hypothetical protein
MILPTGADREYLDAIGISAVFIATVDHFCILRTSRDLAASEHGMRQVWPEATIVAAWWVREHAQADQLVKRIKSEWTLTHDLIPGDVDQVRGVLLSAAAQQSLKLTEHATVIKRAAAAAVRIRETLNIANGRGELAWFNRAYRAYRLQVQGRECGRPINYAAARARLCRAMARRLVLVQQVEFGPELLAEVFGRDIHS